VRPGVVGAGKYGAPMETIWHTSLAAQYRATLDDLAIVLRGCPDELWEASMWEPKKTDPWVWPPTDPEGRPFDDPVVRERKFQATSAVWRTAAHALFFVDADLSAMEHEWAPRAPFSAHDEDGYVVPPTSTREQLLGYIDHCRRKVDEVFAALTDRQAVEPVAETHRRRGTPLAIMLVEGVVHLQLHSAQIRTFLRTQGIRCEDE
jgi:hypothetical protein